MASGLTPELTLNVANGERNGLVKGSHVPRNGCLASVNDFWYYNSARC